MRSLFVIAAILLLAAGSADAAALLRFINTVPTRFNRIPWTTAGITGSISNSATPTSNNYASAGHVITSQLSIDRIGLQYYSGAANGVSTVVWTEPLTPSDSADNNEGSSAYSPYYWTQAMPPLRQYHQQYLATGAQPGLVDRVAAYTSAQIPDNSPTITLNPAETDVYEHSFLKADGVGLYLSFAAGTYSIQAYAAVSDAVGTAAGVFSSAATAAGTLGAAPKQLTGTYSTFTFQDNRVYTLVAIGNGAYGASPATSGNTVSLKLFEESTAPATFGKASIRFFHAIRSIASTDTLTIYQGATASGTPVASGIAFGGLSAYIDFAPNTAQTFALAAGATPNAVLAPTSSGKTETTHDLRAGLRGTIICAYNSEDAASIFCRLIPSRVVSYVRLVNDLAGQSSLTLGAAGSVALSKVNLTLWASYEFPRPDQVNELSQAVGIRGALNSPANFRGLYKVVSKVSSNFVAGYGEVFVPVIIMDFAIRYVIVRDSPADLAASNTVAFGVIGGTNTGFADKGSNQILPTVSGNQWFWGSPIFKRVHFVVKTDSGATLSGSSSFPQRTYSATGNEWVQSAALLDVYFEPGEYYTLIVTPPSAATTTSSNSRPSDVRFLWHKDRSIDTVSAGVASGKGAISITPIGGVAGASFQDYTGGILNVRNTAGVAGTLAGSGGQGVSVAIDGVSTSFGAIPIGSTATVGAWNTPNTYVTVNAGAYTLDFTASSSAVACLGQIPGTISLTLNSGDVFDLFVLNSYGCLNSNRRVNTNLLQVTPAANVPSSATGNDAGTATNPDTVTSTTTTTTAIFFAAAPAVSASLSLVIAAIFAAIAALL